MAGPGTRMTSVVSRSNSEIQRFSTRDAASTAAAARMAGLIDAQLRRDGDAYVVVSGGTTPSQCFGYLSGYDLAWNRVSAVLSDERWVASDHDDSNEKLVRETLLVDKASTARVLSVYADDLSVDERCDSLQSFFPASGFSCALVGMGNDGHFASLFPDADSLAAGLNLDNDRFYIPVRTSASPHARISMTLRALAQSEEILLLIFGAEKLAVYEQAMAAESSDSEGYPVVSLLQQELCPVQVYWAP